MEFVRYLGILENLFEAIMEDMNREDFIVSDKYKTKYEELGKAHTISPSLSHFPDLVPVSLRAIFFLSNQSHSHLYLLTQGNIPIG